MFIKFVVYVIYNIYFRKYVKKCFCCKFLSNEIKLDIGECGFDNIVLE